MPSVKVLGTRVDLLSKKEVQQKLLEYLRSGKPHFVVTANAEMYYQASQDKVLQDILNQADLAVPDSVGIILALRRKNKSAAELYPGVEICQWLFSQDIPVYVLGTRADILAKLKQPNLVGQHHGFFKEAEVKDIIREIQAKRPKVLMVALGAGRQEKWIAKYKTILQVPLLLGVGGAIDVLAGQKRRAPALFRSLHLEWFYRLLAEPLRIIRQYKLFLFWLAVRKDKS